MLKLKECGCIVAILISLLTFNHSYSTEGPSLNINEYLNEIHSLQASFKQSIYSPANDVIDYTEGSVLLKKPGNIMWQFTVPSLKRIIVRNQKISTYDANLNQVVIVPFSDRYQSSLANILLKNDSLMSYYQISSETSNNNVYSVFLVQKESNNLFTKMKITVVEMLLTEIKLWDASGQSIAIIFDDVILNAPLSDSSFEISIPEGTDVFDQTS
ncbi:MAG TPA: outer membrane lipoprotein carrier protein LolA [Gammaproteobacteria bacterium]|jgi:outer membrane lipoprotein carrier protein|nr:outer membrane lipoprotein carrier protein LolA [Gammaproteobacteria bacterium]